MARGWESKSVESQIEAAEARAASKAPRMSAEEAERLRQRESLLLQRRRIEHDLEAAQNPGYREILRAALQHLDGKLAELS